MATIKKYFLPEDAIFADTAFPQYKRINGTNFPISVLGFDADANQGCFFRFAANDYGAGNSDFIVNVYWYADGSITAAEIVVWEAQVNINHPATAINFETDTLTPSTPDNVQDNPTTTANDLQIAQITIARADLDSVLPDDFVTLRIGRDIAPTDDLTGDANLVLVELTYSDAA